MSNVETPQPLDCFLFLTFIYKKSNLNFFVGIFYDDIDADIHGYPDQRVDLTLQISDYTCRIQGKFDLEQHEQYYFVDTNRLYVMGICKIPSHFVQKRKVKIRLDGDVIQNDGKNIPVDLEINELPDPYTNALLIEINPKGQTELSVSSAACPWVYVHDGKDWQRRVEIIQNLLGKQNEKEQTVSLEKVPIQNRSVKIRIQEDKPEISYLDYIVLKIGDQTTHPVLPMDDPLMKKDFQYLVLQQKERIDLTFVTPNHTPLGEEINITASGYYLRE